MKAKSLVRPVLGLKGLVLGPGLGLEGLNRR